MRCRAPKGSVAWRCSASGQSSRRWETAIERHERTVAVDPDPWEGRSCGEAARRSATRLPRMTTRRRLIAVAAGAPTFWDYRAAILRKRVRDECQHLRALGHRALDDLGGGTDQHE